MNSIQKKWTIVDIIKTTTKYLKSKNIENPRLNAEQLLSHVLNIPRIQLYIQFEKILSIQEIDLFRQLVQRRASQEPLQYITGETEFMGLKFKVSPGVLIPRPETEILVENVLEKTKQLRNKNISMMDIGTGSGCIAISLAHFLPDAVITATDVSEEALDCCKQNIILNNIQNINLINHDILNTAKLPVNYVDFVLSNPPYIGKDEFFDLPLEIKNHEPVVALTDLGNGLLFFEKLLSLIAKDLQCKFAFFEINALLKEQIVHLAKKYHFNGIEIINDYNNLPRILKITN